MAFKEFLMNILCCGEYNRVRAHDRRGPVVLPGGRAQKKHYGRYGRGYEPPTEQAMRERGPTPLDASQAESWSRVPRCMPQASHAPTVPTKSADPVGTLPSLPAHRGARSLASTATSRSHDGQAIIPVWQYGSNCFPNSRTPASSAARLAASAASRSWATTSATSTTRQGSSPSWQTLSSTRSGRGS